MNSEDQRFPTGADDVYIAAQAGIRQHSLERIAPLVKQSIANGGYPGAVILVSHHGQTTYRGVFGNLRVVLDMAPMRFDAIFDLASLTKVMVTTTAIMQLIESGQLDLDATVAHYWPAFAKNDKDKLTLRELLTHTSGLPALLPEWPMPADQTCLYAAGLRQIEQISLIDPPGTVFTYGDINFLILGYLVELISGKGLAEYAQQHIFQPLNMTSATFLPSMIERERLSPTTSPADQQPRWGQVNDPTTERMGGVTGVAGLFATASDLEIFCQCLLNGGRIHSSHYLLSPLTVSTMTTPQTPAGMKDVRGLGWDIDSRYASRGALLPVGSYGHTGWTGTSIWIDPSTQTSIIILASRTHPTLAKKNQLITDRRAIANIVASSLTMLERRG